MPNFYDTERAVAEYLLFHYAPPEIQMPWGFGPGNGVDFPARCVTETFEPVEGNQELRALDLGCAVGRSTFELSRSCSEVIGIDASERFIETAQAIQRAGVLPYEATMEGDHRQSLVARRPADSHPDRIHFETGDALRLREDLGTFDWVLAANLLDRVPRPAELLRGFADLVRPGGQLVLTSPYTWLEEYTPRSEWLGGADRRTTDVLAEHLEAFQLVRRRDLPFVLREHERKFQWSVAEATIWIRR